MDVAVSTCETSASVNSSQYLVVASGGTRESDIESVSMGETDSEKDALSESEVESLVDWLREAEGSSVPVSEGVDDGVGPDDDMD